MDRIMNCNEIGKKIGLSGYITRIILCRQEFNKYATYHKANVGYSRISYKISREFLYDLLNIIDLKRLEKQKVNLKEWINEYN